MSSQSDILGRDKNVAAVIVAAGRGTRVGGDTPKQFRMLQGKRVVDWSIWTCLKSPLIAQTVVVVPSDWLTTIEKEWQGQHSLYLIPGGISRTESVKAGLEILQNVEQVLIHDAARPGINETIIEAILTGLKKSKGVAPVLEIFDTIKRVKGNVITTENRTEFFRAQTPQGFDFITLYKFLKNAEEDYSDELQVLEAGGASIGIVAGQGRLAKLTTTEDFENYQFDLQEE